MYVCMHVNFTVILSHSGRIYNKPNFHPERQGVATNMLTDIFSAQKLGYCSLMSFLFVDRFVACHLILWTFSLLNYRVCYKLSHQRMVRAQVLT